MFNILSKDVRNNWAQTCANLQKAFEIEDKNDEKHFWSRSQKMRKSVAAFAAIFRALGKKDFPDHNEVIIEQVLFREFFSRLTK